MGRKRSENKTKKMFLKITYEVKIFLTREYQILCTKIFERIHVPLSDIPTILHFPNFYVETFK